MSRNKKALDEMKRLYREFVDTVFIEDVNIGLVMTAYNLFIGYSDAMIMTTRSRRMRRRIYQHQSRAIGLYNQYMLECSNQYVELGVVLEY